jgi:uncharacterized protein YecA (UPF0149 family)
MNNDSAQAQKMSGAAIVALASIGIETMPVVTEIGPSVQRHYSSGLPVFPSVAGRNQMCPCGSGKKYKRCHFGKPLVTAQENV